MMNKDVYNDLQWSLLYKITPRDPWTEVH